MTTFPVGGSHLPPTPGVHDAVCAEFSFSESRFDGGKVQGRLTFEVEELDNEGKRRCVAFYFNQKWGSVQKPSKIRQFVDAWFGKKHSNQELVSFDITSVVGKPAQLKTTISDGGSGVIVGVRSLPDDVKPLTVSAGYQPRGNYTSDQQQQPRHQSAGGYGGGGRQGFGGQQSFGGGGFGGDDDDSGEGFSGGEFSTNSGEADPWS